MTVDGATGQKVKLTAAIDGVQNNVVVIRGSGQHTVHTATMRDECSTQAKPPQMRRTFCIITCRHWERVYCTGSGGVTVFALQSATSSCEKQIPVIEGQLHVTVLHSCLHETACYAHTNIIVPLQTSRRK
jgi:hypothetical protein